MTPYPQESRGVRNCDLGEEPRRSGDGRSGDGIPLHYEGFSANADRLLTRAALTVGGDRLLTRAVLILLPSYFSGPAVSNPAASIRIVLTTSRSEAKSFGAMVSEVTVTVRRR